MRVKTQMRAVVVERIQRETELMMNSFGKWWCKVLLPNQTMLHDDVL